MKTTKFFVMMAAMVAVMFSACKPTNEPVTVTLDKEQITVAVNASVKLTATVTPAGSAVIWSVDDSSIAVVTNGTVVGKAEGNTKVYATCGDVRAECAVTVNGDIGPGVDLSQIACLQGTKYFPWILSETAMAYLEGNGAAITWVGANGPGNVDGVLQNSQNLWFWDGTVGVGQEVGTNSFGEMAGYLALQVINADAWGGAGGGAAFNIAKPADFPSVERIDMSDIYAHPNQYFLHIALKQLDPSFSLTLELHDGAANGSHKVSFVFGNLIGFDDRPVTHPIPQDGDWHEFEIPCTQLVAGDAMMYQNPFYDENTFVMLIKPANATMHLDAAFIYKK